MVQFVKIAVVLATAFSSFEMAAAKSCKSGGIYCGFALLKRGDYITKIITNLRANNLPTDDFYIKQSLWSCLEHGDISLIEMCSLGCNGGDSKDDFCNGSPSDVA
ncbi:hypothetical protein AAE478_007692 [Parahypoxylon ruwenzoriense]